MLERKIMGKVIAIDPPKLALVQFTCGIQQFYSFDWFDFQPQVGDIVDPNVEPTSIYKFKLCRRGKPIAWQECGF